MNKEWHKAQKGQMQDDSSTNDSCSDSVYLDVIYAYSDEGQDRGMHQRCHCDMRKHKGKKSSTKIPTVEMK